MIETINEQQIKFANKMWEYNLSHETDLRFSSPRFDVNFCDDGTSFSLLESGLEEVLDPPLTTFPFVTPSSFRTSVDENDLCYWLGDLSTQVHDCHQTFLGSSCVDLMGPTGPDVIDHISPNHVNMLHVSPLPLPPSLFLECHNSSVISYHDILKGKV